MDKEIDDGILVLLSTKWNRVNVLVVDLLLKHIRVYSWVKKAEMALEVYRRVYQAGRR